MDGILISSGEVDQRLEKMSYDVLSHYDNKPFVMLSMLGKNSIIKDKLLTNMSSY